MSLNTKTICQISIVVRDVERTAANYARLFDMPSPEIIDIPPYAEVPIRYKGKPMDTKGCRLCVFKLENIVLELIEPNPDIPSAWREHLYKHGQSVHHIGFIVDDQARVLKELEAENCPAVMAGYMNHLTYVFTDSVEAYGVNFNIKERGQHNQALIQFLLENPDKTASDFQRE